LQNEWEVNSRLVVFLHHQVKGGAYYHYVDTSASGRLVPEGIIRPVVSDSALTWFIGYIYCRNLQLLNYLIIIKSKV